MTKIKVQIDIQTATAILLSLAYLIAFANAAGFQAFLGTLVYLVLPWLLLTNAEALGEYSFGSPGGKYLSITRGTPRLFVIIIGWLFLIAPGVYFILAFR